MKRLTKYTIPETGFSVVSEEKYKRILMEEKPSVEKVYNRLKKIEDILGDEYDLDELREMAQAKRDGRCVVLPCKVGDPVFMGTGRSKITGYEEDVCDGFYLGRNGVLQVKVQNHKGNHGTYGVIGQTAELTREAAERALKGDQHEQNL